MDKEKRMTIKHSPNKKHPVFTVKSSPKQLVRVKREFKIFQPDVERQLKHCVRVVQTISSIRHSFINAKQNKLAYEFEQFAKLLIEFHHWRLVHHLKTVTEQVSHEVNNGYVFDEQGQPGVIEVDIKSAYFGRLIDILLDMDKFMQASAKLALTGNYLAHDIQELNGKVVGVLRDINTTMQSIKATLSKEFGVTSDQNSAKAIIDKVDFAIVKTSVDQFYVEQTKQFEIVKERTRKGDSNLVNKRNQSSTMQSNLSQMSIKKEKVDDAFDLAFSELIK